MIYTSLEGSGNTEKEEVERMDESEDGKECCDTLLWTWHCCHTNKLRTALITCIGYVQDGAWNILAWRELG